MEDVFATGTIVWASAKSDIFWPAEVVEPESEDPAKGLVAAVHFLVEDSYENIRSQKKIFPWNCFNQDKFIHKGRALKNDQRRIEFNKALAEADKKVAVRSENVGAKQDKRTQVERCKESTEDSNSSQDTSTFCSSDEKYICTGDMTRKNGLGSGRSRSEEKGGKASKEIMLTTPRKRRKSSLAVACDNVVRKESIAKCDQEMKTPVRNLSKDDRCKSFKESPGAKSFKRNLPEEKCAECAVSSRTKKQKVNLWNRRARKQCLTVKEQTDNSNLMREDLSQGSGNFPAESPFGTIPSSTESCLSSDCGNTYSENNENKTVVNKGNEIREKHCIKGTKETQKTSSDTSVETSTVTGCAMLMKSGSTEKPPLKQKQENGQKSSINATGDTNVSCSDESSDDELLVPFSPSQEISEFAVGDVVWAKYYREPHWPAQIKKVTGKRESDRKFLVHFLSWNETLFRVQPRKLVHFACDPAQRAKFLSIQDEFKDSAQKRLFVEALNKAEDLVNRKGLGKSEEDDFAEGSLESLIGERKDDDEKPTPRNSKLFLEKRKSTRLKRKVSKYRDILSYIRQAKTTLKQIYNGEKPCERHRIFTSGTVREKDNLKHQAGFGPIGDSLLQEDILKLLLDYYKEVRGDTETLDVRYVSDVWLPEAMIWSIQKIDNVNRTMAETFYRNGSEYAVTRTEVQELASQLKQRSLSAEEKEARLRKAKRALERLNYSF